MDIQEEINRIRHEQIEIKHEQFEILRQLKDLLKHRRLEQKKLIEKSTGKSTEKLTVEYDYSDNSESEEFYSELNFNKWTPKKVKGRLLKLTNNFNYKVMK